MANAVIFLLGAVAGATAVVVAVVLYLDRPTGKGESEKEAQSWPV